MAQQEEELLIRLSKAINLREAEDIIRELEVRFHYTWRPVGDNEANYGLINIGSDPGIALIERVTNALDSIIEREALLHFKKKKWDGIPTSPREAVELWFGIRGGHVANLSDPSKRQPIADQVIVTLLEGKYKRRPTVVIRDQGVGLTPEQIPSTILSLSGTNKIDKPYLAGAYGQGGSTALAFSPEGTLFVSRRQPDLLENGQADVVAITFAKYEELDPAKNKNGRYSYLVTQKLEVPHVQKRLLPDFTAGTCVVQFNMGIEQYAARMTQLTGSLWWLSQNQLFDPVLPFWIEDARPSILGGGKEKERRTIAGNYTRLMDDRRDRIEHSDSVTVHIDHQKGASTVKVNYWVVRSKEEGKSPQPIDAYVDPYKPIAYTYFGQTHGTDERRFSAERLQLSWLAKFLIIQVELDYLIPAARRELLSSTRDRLKRTSLFDEMRERICSALAEDEELIRLNMLRKDEILSRYSEKERERIRQRFAQLIEKLRQGDDAAISGKGSDKGDQPPSKSPTREPLERLPTKDEPTFIRIANAKVPVPIRLDRHALIRLESDAPDGYLTEHIHAKLTMASDPKGLLNLESRSDFRGGRARLTVKSTEKEKAGTEGTLTVFLFTPDDKYLSDQVRFRLESPREQPKSGEGGRVQVKVPEPIPVRRDQWPDFGWNETSVADVREDKIFVNMDNQHLDHLLKSSGYQERGINRMRNNFLLYVAFYAWVRHIEMVGREIGLQGKEFEDYQAAELDRVAQTVIHSMAAEARVADEE